MQQVWRGINRWEHGSKQDKPGRGITAAVIANCPWCHECWYWAFRADSTQTHYRGTDYGDPAATPTWLSASPENPFTVITDNLDATRSQSFD